jgi:hypothetical protein
VVGIKGGTTPSGKALFDDRLGHHAVLELHLLLAR